MGQGLFIAKSVSEAYYGPLSWSEHLADETLSLGGGEFSLYVLHQAVVTAYYVNVCKWISVSVNVYGVAERDLHGKLLLRT